MHASCGRIDQGQQPLGDHGRVRKGQAKGEPQTPSSVNAALVDAGRGVPNPRRPPHYGSPGEEEWRLYSYHRSEASKARVEGGGVAIACCDRVKPRGGPDKAVGRIVY
jgi:hypothetical protein